MKASDYTPKGKRMKRSERSDFVPYRSTETMSYSLRPEQIEFVRESGGSKFIRLILDAAMGLETKDNQRSQKLIDEAMGAETKDSQKAKKLIDEVMK
ncbi:hypothetical protein FG061_06545 [Vibrio cholerae]|nr:hypothetical protein [Vibrio cholerae]